MDVKDGTGQPYECWRYHEQDTKEFEHETIGVCEYPLRNTSASLPLHLPSPIHHYGGKMERKKNKRQ